MELSFDNLNEVTIKDENKGGIYCIKNLYNSKFYIGSTNDLYHRTRHHLSSLRNNTHHNIHLQRAWNKYGENNFVFLIVRYVKNEDLLIRFEQTYINQTKCFDVDIGYNISTIAGRLGNYEVSDKTKQKISKSLRGRKQSKKHIKRRADAKRGKSNVKIAKKVVQLDKNGNYIRTWFGIFNTEEYGFIPSCVSAVCRRKRDIHKDYYWVYFEEYKNENFDFEEYKNRFKRKNKKEAKKKIIKQNKNSALLLQFSLDGKLLKKWDSRTNACNSVGGNIKVYGLDKERVSSYGFIWMYEDFYNKNIKTLDIFITPILQYKDNQLLNIWYSSLDIKKRLNLNNRYINQICNNGGGNAYGYFWIYKE